MEGAQKRPVCTCGLAAHTQTPQLSRKVSLNNGQLQHRPLQPAQIKPDVSPHSRLTLVHTPGQQGGRPQRECQACGCHTHI